MKLRLIKILSSLLIAFISLNSCRLGSFEKENLVIENDVFSKTFWFDSEKQGSIKTSINLKLSGTIIGTSGSYNNLGNTKEKAMDGDLASFFDGPTADGVWVGLDLGLAKTISKVKYAPRPAWASRMNGGKIQASNSSDFSNLVELLSITSTPAENVLTTATITNTSTFRYVRYLAPAGAWGNIAELEFWTGQTTIAVTGVSVSPTSASVEVGATQQLTATVSPSDATNKNVSWSTSNALVATVNSSGLVSGVAAGTATITVTTEDGGKTATSSITVTSTTSVVYQAESYTAQSGCSTSTQFAGYSGTGYVDYGGNGTYIEWNNVNSLNAISSATLSFVYANGGTVDRQCAVIVNGTNRGNVSFSPTGAWTTWQPVTINVPLNAGNNTIRVTANTTNGGPNLDKVDVSGSGLKGAYLDSKERTNSSLLVYPNPASSVSTFTIIPQGVTNGVLSIFDVTGRLVHTQHGVGSEAITLSLSDINVRKGSYMVRITSGVNVITSRLVVQ